MNVIGIDLSLRATGMSDGHTTWTVHSKGTDTDSLTQRCLRIQGLMAVVLTHCYDADLVVIEQPAFSRQTGHMHDRSGLWWLVVGELHDRGTPVAEVSPTTLKKWATGKGNAKKGLLADEAARRMPQVQTGGDDNRVDALWLAAMGLAHLDRPVVSLPVVNRQALDAVRWPDPTWIGRLKGEDGAA